MDNWPKHPDGRPKKMSELTRDEQIAVVRKGCETLQKEFNNPLVKEKLNHILNDGKVH